MVAENRGKLGSGGCQRWGQPICRPFRRAGPRRGLQTTAYGHWHAVLERYDTRSGADLETWTDPDDPQSNGDVISGAQLSGDESVFLVAHAPLNILEAPDAAKLTALSVSGAEKPRALFETHPPSGYSIDSATITPVGSHVVVTYTDRFSDHTLPNFPEDDYDALVCAVHPTTWVEVRDLKTSALQAVTRLDNVAVSAATLSGAGVRLAGSVLDPKLCDERAAVFAVDEEGKATPLYSDESIGSSSFAAISPTENGVVCAVGESDYRVDFVAQTINPSASLAEQQLQRRANEREAAWRCVSRQPANWGSPNTSMREMTGDTWTPSTADSQRNSDRRINCGSRGSSCISRRPDPHSAHCPDSLPRRAPAQGPTAGPHQPTTRLSQQSFL